MAEVLAVLNNWRRPFNIPVLIEAIRKQSVPVHLCIIDNSVGTEWALRPDVLREADTVLTVSKTNFGPISRLMPPLMMPKFRYTYFQPDDHVPGRRYIEHLIATASALDGRFATIGQQGRVVKGELLSRQRILPADEPVPAHCIVTNELCLTEHVPHAMAFRSELLRADPNVSIFEDDLILCLGIQRALQLPSFVATQPDTDRSWRIQKLRDDFALCKRPDHYERRTEFVQTAMSIGWRAY